MIPPNNKPKGTGFTNVSKILQANRGNRLGQTVSGGIQQASKDVKTGIQQAQQKFDEESQKNRVDTEQNIQQRQNILGRFNNQSQPMTQQSGVAAPQTTEAGRPAPAVGTAVSGPNTRAGEEAAPVSPTPQQPVGFQGVSDDDVKDFSRFRAASYSGPQELDETGVLARKAAQAQQLSSLAKAGSGGQQELLRRFVGGDGYSQGQKKLDQTILGQGSGSLGAASRDARSAISDVNRASEQSRSVAQELQGRARGFTEETSRMLGETKNPIMQGLDIRLGEAQAKEQELGQNFQSVQDILRGSGDYGVLSEAERFNRGLSQARDMDLISAEDFSAITGSGGIAQRGSSVGLNIQEMINQRLQLKGAQNLTKGGVASEEERTKLQAINRLAGGLESDYALAGQEDQYRAGGINFDQESLDKEVLKTEVPFYRNQISSLQNQLANHERTYNPMWTSVQRNQINAWNAAKSSLQNQLNSAQNKFQNASALQTRYDDASRAAISDENLKEDISYDPKDVEKFMSRLKASSYDYKKEVQDSPLATKNREIGVMAQDLEKSKLGKEAVKDTKIGKVVDYDNLGPKMLASIANLNERIKKMEGK